MYALLREIVFFRIGTCVSAENGFIILLPAYDIAYYCAIFFIFFVARTAATATAPGVVLSEGILGQIIWP